MRKISTEVLSQWAQGEEISSGYVQGVSVDSRLVKKDDLFVCLIGDRVDGHDFADKAIQNGASALLVSKKLDLDIPQILVNDTLEAMKMIAYEYRDTLDIFIIGITGSNGKTSSKDMLNSILSLEGKTWATQSNQNTEIGTYLNLFNLDDTYKYGVFEFGLDMPNEVYEMAKLMKADAALLTSLAPAHMANFKDINHIADEKVRIFDVLENKQYGFYQGDFKEYKERLGKEYKSYGFRYSNDFFVSDVVLKNDGIDFRVNNRDYSSNLMGKHQASNAAGVIALCKELKIDDKNIREGLNNVALTGLRTEIKKHKESLLILDAYKSNPSSSIYALDLMDAYEFDGKRYVVLSEMVELGPESHRAHKQVLDRLRDLKLDGIYTLGQEFKNFENEYDINSYLDWKDFNQDVQKLFDEKALILIKGSRSYALERLVRKDD